MSHSEAGASRLFDLTGQVALVTGSTRGIGLAAARALGAHGATVILHGRDRKQLDALSGSLRAEGLQVDAEGFDVTDTQAATAAVDRIVARHGALHILFANAGVTHRKKLLEDEQADFERVVFTNLTAQWALARRAAHHMVAAGHGRIVFAGSVTAIRGRPNVTAYTAAKGALHALARQWSSELAGKGVTVNALAPGYIQTELTRALQEDASFDEWLRKATPVGRWGTPDDLRSAILFLAARESGFFTGQTLTVDGGLTACL
jgi:gluconate 5-dehydrogenase